MANFTKKEIAFIKKNYPSKGSIFCGAKLNRPAHLVRQKAYRLGVTIDDDRKIQYHKDAVVSKINNKKPEDYKVNPTQFMSEFTKESAYILGMLWADGHIDIKKNRITLSIKESDANCILDTFIKTGPWKITQYKRKNRAPQKTIRTSNRALVSFLAPHNYGPHNHKNATIIDLLPAELKHYWFRGLIDGDGCFFVNLKRRQKILNVSGPIDQDWTFLSCLLDELGIKYVISKTTSSHGNSSGVTVTNYDGIVLFGDYIYENYENDKIGLPRKHDKYTTIKQKLFPIRVKTRTMARA